MQDFARMAAQFGERQFYGNSLAAWALALLVFVVAFYALTWLRGRAARRLKARARPGGRLELVAEVVRRIAALWLLVLALGAAAYTLQLPDKTARLVESAVTIALFAQLALLASYLFTAWAERHAEAQRQRDPAVATTMGAVTVFGRIAIFATTVLLALDNLGLDVTALVAGLGIGGVAIAIASQAILADLFASFSIVFDKPFMVGDFIILDSGYMGTVERVGVKTTRLRSLSGEQIVIANADLLKTRIRNYKQMYERRVVFPFGVTYQTPVEALERIPAMVREAVEALPDTRFDRAHFMAYGDSSLNFEVVYFVQKPDYNVYADRQQAINLALMRKFAAAGIEFAYPTRTLYLQQLASAAPAQRTALHPECGPG
jgi:small-conductance mechanosensitive channel